LLGVSDNEKFSRLHLYLPPIRGRGVVRGEEQEQLRLEEIRILKLVDENVREAPLEFPTHIDTITKQIASPEKLIGVVESPGAALRVIVCLDGGEEFPLEEGRDVCVRLLRECCQYLHGCLMQRAYVGAQVRDRIPFA